MNTILTASRVNQIFLDCLPRDGEDTSNHVEAEGIVGVTVFDRDRLNSYQAEIEAMLDELPSKFKKSDGGGMSFLAACEDKDGNLWTSSHRTMEELFQLGIAVGKVKYQPPRWSWPLLPGGMPYYVVN